MKMRLERLETPALYEDFDVRTEGFTLRNWCIILSNLIDIRILVRDNLSKWFVDAFVVDFQAGQGLVALPLPYPLTSGLWEARAAWLTFLLLCINGLIEAIVIRRRRGLGALAHVFSALTSASCLAVALLSRPHNVLLVVYTNHLDLNLIFYLIKLLSSSIVLIAVVVSGAGVGGELSGFVSHPSKWP